MLPGIDILRNNVALKIVPYNITFKVFNKTCFEIIKNRGMATLFIFMRATPFIFIIFQIVHVEKSFKKFPVMY